MILIYDFRNFFEINFLLKENWKKKLFGFLYYSLFFDSNIYFYIFRFLDNGNYDYRNVERNKIIIKRISLILFFISIKYLNQV